VNRLTDCTATACLWCADKGNERLMLRSSMLRQALIVAMLVVSILATALPASAERVPKPVGCPIGAPETTCGGPSHR
jgi:hypothetical protein